MKRHEGAPSGLPPTVTGNDCSDGFHQGRFSRATGRAKEFVTFKKGAAIVVGAAMAPFLVDGLIQTHDLLDSTVYAVLQVSTFLSSSSPDPDMVRTLIHNITSGNPDTGQQVATIVGEMLDTYKALLVEAGIVGGAVAYTSNFIKRSDTKRQLIQEGQAELEPESVEKVIVLGGKGGHIFRAVIDGHNSGFTPIVENSEAAKALAGSLFTGKPTRPFCINLGISSGGGLSYLKTPGWYNLKLKKEHLIHAVTGEEYLLVVGIGMKPDRELSFDKESVGVSQDDLRSAGLRLRQLFQPGDLEKRNLIDLYIGNGKIQRTDMETGATITDRELAASTGVDIYMDTWDVALKALVDQLVSVGATEVRLATTDPNNRGYRKVFGKQFPKFVHRYAPDSGLVFEPKKPSGDNTVWIVYEGRSEETFMTARRLRKARPDAKIIALVTTDLEEHLESGGLKDVTLVDISAIISNMLKDVRQMLKDGLTPSEIQTAMDEFKLPIPRT